MQNKMEKKETNHEIKCDHVGHWKVSGETGLNIAKAIFIITSLYCENCGQVVSASRLIPLPMSNIAVPETNIISTKH